MLGHILGVLTAIALVFLILDTVCPEWLRKRKS